MIHLDAVQAKEKLHGLISELSERKMTPVEFWHLNTRLTTEISGIDETGTPSRRLSESNTQIAMLADVAKRSLANLEWTLNNTQCGCKRRHTCGMEDRLKELEKIKRQMALALGCDEKSRTGFH